MSPKVGKADAVTRLQIMLPPFPPKREDRHAYPVCGWRTSMLGMRALASSHVLGRRLMTEHISNCFKSWASMDLQPDIIRSPAQ